LINNNGVIDAWTQKMPKEEWAVKTLVAWCWIDIATFFFVLGFSLHNAVKFLVIQGRWRKLYLTGFYVLTVLMTLIRIIFFYSSFRMLVLEEREPDWILSTKMH